MRIGICLRTWGEKGGIGVYSRNLLDALIPMDTRNQYVLMYSGAQQVGRFAGYPHVTELHVRAPSKLLWDQVAVPYQAARERLDVLLHTKMAVPLAAPCKTVMVLHGSERFVYPQFSEKSDLLFFKTLYPLFLRRAAAIISVSENARRDVIRFLRLSPAKIRTIYMAAAPGFRRIDDRSALEAVRAKYGLPERFVLNVGLIYPGKNIPNLLRALQIVRKSVDVKLVIAGKGRRMYREDLRKIRELGLDEHVVLPGYIGHDDLAAVYNLADVVAYPSFYESFGLVTLEANACGVPVVASRAGGSPEAGRDAALYVDPLDVEAIAGAIGRALSDDELRRRLIDRGLENAKRFSWESTARLTLDMLESLDSARGPYFARQTSPEND